MIAYTNLLFTISSLALLALSVPLKLRDVVDPPITSPTAGTVWQVGETQLVTWSTTGLSPNVTNPVGMLVLGYMYNNSENLMLNAPLATNINYMAGQAQITVPIVDTRDDYIVVLFGDSGNASPEFTITNDSSSSSASVSSTSTSSPQSTAPIGSASLTTQASTESPTSTPGTTLTSTSGTTSTPTAGTVIVTLSSQATSVATSVASPTQSTLTGAAWRNHASGPSILLALISAVYIL
ncbi:hypothetical protein AZE42_03192 [Rhizopogon vesiculosus]|uniref:Uncharacterized protein n=1 Tax=Rhizopogon vesiculosus TaxID=180088 RepID=A0A1J8Q456_9AGAM|nr:hypothetical protein AZE42_03192 [Rhizopogon vesiculosus]